MRNPSKVGGRAELDKLSHALKDGTCKWVKLNEDEHRLRIQSNAAQAERGEPVYKARRKRAAKALGKYQSEEFVCDSDEGTEGDGSNGGVEA